MLFYWPRKMRTESIFFAPPPEAPRNLSLTWKNISYTVERKVDRGFLKAFCGGQHVEMVQLLHGVSGMVKSGTLMAVMGPSGAGKTTLLATISRRIKGEASGEILLNGQPVDAERMVRMSGFVPQQDLAVESLTVQEHMEFMARMKMDRRFRNAVRKQRIATLLEDLGLNKCYNSRLSTLSGGERKRVSLAVQLLTEPSLLFCDEPTTGLDSYAAMSVARTLREVAARGRAVVCSLHQPASGLLDLFHEVLLLAAGRVAFQGTSDDASRFFESSGLRCPPTFNSAEFHVSQLSITGGREAEGCKKAAWICDKFESSDFGEKIARAIEDSCRTPAMFDAPHPVFSQGRLPVDDFKRIRAFTQLRWLVWRAYIDYKRHAHMLLLRFAFFMFIALMLSVPYAGDSIGVDQPGIQNVQGLMYLVVTEAIFTFNYGVVYTFPSEMPFLLRDIASDLYHPAPYYISKVAVLIPGAVFQPFVYSVLVYAIAGLEGGVPGFLQFTLPVILCANSACAVGCLMSAAFESVETASLLAVPVDVLSIIFSGIFLHLGNLPAHISWLKYVSQFYYGTEAVSLLHWREIEHINCPPDPEEPCISTGLEVLEKYGYEPGNYFLDLLGLFSIFAISHFGGFLAIYHRSRKEPVY